MAKYYSIERERERESVCEKAQGGLMGFFSCVDSRVEEKSNHQKVGVDRPEVHPSAPSNNFSHDCFLGVGGFGHVYRGRLQGSGQVESFCFSDSTIFIYCYKVYIIL